MMSVLAGKPLVLHEQNSVAGMANRVLAGVADRVFSAFPHVMKKASWIGNPLRPVFLQQPGPQERLGARTGPLKLLVVGGSLGRQGAERRRAPGAGADPARQAAPGAQSGAKQIDALRANYAAAGVEAG